MFLTNRFRYLHHTEGISFSSSIPFCLYLFSLIHSAFICFSWHFQKQRSRTRLLGARGFEQEFQQGGSCFPSPPSGMSSFLWDIYFCYVFWLIFSHSSTTLYFRSLGPVDKRRDNSSRPFDSSAAAKTVKINCEQASLSAYPHINQGATTL